MTVFLSAEAAALLEQMTAYSKRTQSELLSEAVERIASSYSYWNVDRPHNWDYDEDEEYFEGWDWAPEETVGWRKSKPVPPWFVEQERLVAAERRALDLEIRQDDVGLGVYRRGFDRNKLQK